MDKEKALNEAVAIKQFIENTTLIDLQKIIIDNPNLSVEGLLRLAWYANYCKTIDSYHKNKQQAKEEYLDKFLADVEKLKAEKEKKYNENEVKYGKA